MEDELKVLILEDVQFDVELIEYELRRENVKFQSKQVETEKDFIEGLDNFKPDIILADHSLPQFDGLSALEITKKRYSEIPFIFVSGKIGDEFAVEMLKKGATDYVFKNNLSKLVPAIRRALTERDELVELKKSKKQLQKALEEKEMLLKEIHHRVKNNLMIISNLLELQSHYIQNKTDLNFFRESQNRAASMALIHERLYQSTDLKSIDFGDYIRTLAIDLFDVYSIVPDQIKLITNVEDIILDINTAIPLGLILNELLTNSLKYAFPTASGRGPTDGTSVSPATEDRGSVNDGVTSPKISGRGPTDETSVSPAVTGCGSSNLQSSNSEACGQELENVSICSNKECNIITIKFIKTNDEFTLIIKDNGIGFPEDIDYKNTGTLGLELVNRLTKQLNGTIKLDTLDGTEFKITFKELEI